MDEPVTVMWEVRVAAGCEEQVLAILEAGLDPAAQVYRSAEQPPRVVVLDASGRGVPDVPAALIDRPPHEWGFRAVARNRSPRPGVNQRAGRDAGAHDGSGDPPAEPADPRPGDATDSDRS